MNCMEARRMVTPFVRGELPDRDLEKFLKHIEQCSDCMDELDICFTVYQAMDLLGTGERREYDLKKMLQDSIRAARTHLLLNRVSRIVRAAGFCCAEILLALSIYTAVQTRLGHQEASVFQRVMLTFHRPAEQILEEESEQTPPQELSERISEIMQEQHQMLHERAAAESE